MLPIILESSSSVYLSRHIFSFFSISTPAGVTLRALEKRQVRFEQTSKNRMSDKKGNLRNFQSPFGSDAKLLQVRSTSLRFLAILISAVTKPRGSLVASLSRIDNKRL